MIPAISIGNLAMGGRGKTPVVAHVARLLLARGERPAILSRGYGRRIRDDGVTVVSDGAGVRADVDRAGDEPLMLARALPGAVVLVCEQRAIAATLAEHAFAATVAILDDGFQHRAMARDVDIVLVAPDDFTDRRLPFGGLREPVSALARADAVIVDAGPAAARAAPSARIPPDVTAALDRLARSRASVGRIYALTRSLGEPVPLPSAPSSPSRDLPIVAVAGIAAPARFVASLEQSGWRVARALTFSDHHRYRPADLARIADAVRVTGAGGVLTTAKDAVRLDAAGGLSVPAGVIPLDVEIEPADGFRAWLLERIDRARGAGRAGADGADEEARV